jgi:hypothetical protein
MCCAVLCCAVAQDLIEESLKASAYILKPAEAGSGKDPKKLNFSSKTMGDKAIIDNKAIERAASDPSPSAPKVKHTSGKTLSALPPHSAQIQLLEEDGGLLSEMGATSILEELRSS